MISAKIFLNEGMKQRLHTQLYDRVRSITVSGSTFENLQEIYSKNYKIYEGIIPEEYYDYFNASTMGMIGSMPQDKQKQVRFVSDDARQYVSKVERKINKFLLKGKTNLFRFKTPRHNVPLPVLKTVEDEVNNEFLYQNNGVLKLQEMIREALIAGVSFGKIYIGENRRELSYDFDSIPETQLEELLVQLTRQGATYHLDEDVVGMAEDGITSLLTGRVDWTIDEEYVAYDHIPLYDIIFDPAATDFRSAGYLGYRQEMTGQALLDLEYVNRRQLERGEIVPDSDEGGLSFYLRDMMMDASNITHIPSTGIPRVATTYDEDFLSRTYVVYEHYLESAIPTKMRRSRLYKIITIGGEIMHIEEAKMLPFFAIKPEACNQVVGSSIMTKVEKEVMAMTKAFRMEETKADLAANPNLGVVKGAYNKQDVIDGRLARKIVEVDTPEAVFLLNDGRGAGKGDHFSLLQMMKNEAEEAGKIVDPAAIPMVAASTMQMYNENQEESFLFIAEAITQALKDGVQLFLQQRLLIDKPFVVKDMMGNTSEVQTRVLAQFAYDINVSISSPDVVKAKANTAAQTIQQAMALGQQYSPAMYEFFKKYLEAHDADEWTEFLPNPTKSPEQLQQEQAMMAQQMAAQQRSQQLLMEQAMLSNAKAELDLVRIKKELEELTLDNAHKVIEMDQKIKTEAAEREKTKAETFKTLVDAGVAKENASTNLLKTMASTADATAIIVS